MSKPRLFLDMDGTLAEFKKIHIDIKELEEAQTANDKIQEILRTPGYFYHLKPHQNVINAIKIIIQRDEFEVFVNSRYIPNCTAQYEKNQWLDKYLPEIDCNHRIFVPDGEDKKLYVPNGVTKSDYLLDDYTPVLNDWNTCGTGIKLWNGINGNNGEWKGNAVRYDRNPEKLADAIISIIQDKEQIKDIRPQEDMEYEERE